jgi:release factor glutamine methyltransferase
MFNDNSSQNLIKKGKEILEGHSIENAELDARIILQFVTDSTREEIFLNNPLVTNQEQQNFLALINRRAQNEPLAYILEKKEFYGLDFIVNPKVLIPRPDTEIIIEEVLRYYSTHDKLSILDLGTGSGSIIITLLTLFYNATGIGIDISLEALIVAEKNALAHQVNNRLRFIQSDWNSYQPNNKFDLIVSNPPYIPSAEYDQLSSNVKDYEPKIALLADQNGLSNYSIIAKIAAQCLKEGGLIIVEFGYNQAEAVKEIFEKNNFLCRKISKDLSSIQRIAIFSLKNMQTNLRSVVPNM